MGHLRDNDFEVTLHEIDDIAALQEEHGVPSDMRGCHSAMIGEHMVEGHVPADLLMRFLEESRSRHVSLHLCRRLFTRLPVLKCGLRSASFEDQAGSLMQFLLLARLVPRCIC